MASSARIAKAESIPHGVVRDVKAGAVLDVPVIEIEEDDPDRMLARRPKTTEGQPDNSNHKANENDHEDQDQSLPEPGDEESDSEDADEGDDVWEKSSFIEAVFDQVDEIDISETTGDSPDTCTLEESKRYRRLLRQLGVEDFIHQTLETEGVSARKLCTAFGLRVSFLEDSPDTAYYRLLGLAIQRELQKRVKLEQWNTLNDAVQLLKGAKNVIVVTGAGISTSLGIPDFRSAHSGLYARLAHLGLSDAQEVFAIDLFRDDPAIFYSVAKDILPETKKFTPTHAFIKMLQDRGKLLVNYTQNIDNIETHAGVQADKLIQCHGSFATATCQKCGHQVQGDEIHDEIKAGNTPKCKVCIQRSQQIKPVALKRKRSSDHRRDRSRQRDYDDDDSGEEFNEEPGTMKPDITFFGEQLPESFHDRLKDTDYSTVDLIIVMGTSLKVAPVSEIPNFVAGQNENIPQIYISRDPCDHIEFDIQLLGECDVVVAALCRGAGWEMKHEMLVPESKGIEVIQAGQEHQWIVRVKE